MYIRLPHHGQKHSWLLLRNAASHLEGSSHFIFRVNTATVNCSQECGFDLDQTNEQEYAREISTIKERS